MKYQSPGLCGPYAIVNALRCLGIKVSGKYITSLTRTNPEVGTDDVDMLRALSDVGSKTAEFKATKRSDGVTWLNYALGLGPVILCIDAWSHWLVCAGRCGEKYILIDSSNTHRNVAENGVHVVSRSELVRRWYNRQKNELYAIGVSK